MKLCSHAVTDVNCGRAVFKEVEQFPHPIAPQKILVSVPRAIAHAHSQYYVHLSFSDLLVSLVFYT